MEFNFHFGAGSKPSRQESAEQWAPRTLESVTQTLKNWSDIGPAQAESESARNYLLGNICSVPRQRWRRAGRYLKLQAPNILLMSFLWDTRCDQAMTIIKKSNSGAGGYRERVAVSGAIISSRDIALLIVSIFSEERLLCQSAMLHLVTDGFIILNNAASVCTQYRNTEG